MRRRGLLLAALAGVLCIAASASDPSERLPDPAQEARARHLFEQFRCIVCQNESIDDSGADLAHDLRQIVRGQIVQGRSDTQIRAFMVDRYGAFILLKPPFSPGNLALWLTPLLIVLAGGAFFAVRASRPVNLETALSEEEETRLSRLADAGGHDTVPPKIGPRKTPGVT